MAAKPKPPDKNTGIMEAIAAGPPPSGPAESFVGVPADYATQPTVKVQPRYRKGYEYTPAGWPPEDMARLQNAMHAAGLYTPDKEVSLGYFNPEVDVPAFTRLLTYSNASGQDWVTALQQIGTQSRRSLGASGSRARMDITSSEDLKVAAKRMFVEKMGKSPDDIQIDGFVKAYQAMEGSGADGIPSSDAYMGAQAEQANPKEAAAHKWVEKFDMFDKIMTGGGLGITAAQAGQGGGTQGI